MNNFFQSTPKKDDNQPNRFVMSGQQPFQSNQQQNTSISPFQSNSSGLPFGSTNLNSSFQQGSNVPPFSQNTPTFGSMQPSLNTFGSSSSFTPSFGSTSSSPFSSTISNTSSSPSPFSSQSNANPTISMFGNSNISNTPSSFTNSSPFSSTSTLTSPLSNTLNNSFSSNRPWNAGPISSWGAKDKGSKAFPYTSTRIMDDNNTYVELTHINGMKEYSNKPSEEIRKEDYEMSLTPPKQGSTFSPGFSQQSGIGMPFASNSTNVFGSGVSKPFSASGTSSITTTTPFITPIGGTNSTFGGNTTASSFGNNTFNSNSMVSNPLLSSNSSPFGNINSFTSNTGTPLSAGNLSANSNPSPFGNTTGFSNNTGLPLSTNPSQANNSFGNISGPTNSNTSGVSSIFGNTNIQSTGPSIFNSQPSSSSTSSPFGTSSIFGANTGMSNTQNPILNTSNSGTNNPFGSAPSNSILGNQNSISNTNPFTSTMTSGFSPANSTNRPYCNCGSLFSNSGSLGNNSLANNNGTGIFSTAGQLNSNQTANNNDPYLLKSVCFDKFEQQKPNIRIPLPLPLFKSRKETPSVDLQIRPPKTISKNSFYTIPDLRELSSLQSISNLVIGFEGKGRIEFLEPVSLLTPDDIDKRISFRNETVEINDPIGTGLNKKARVFIEGLYPMCRTTNEVIKGKAEEFPQKGIQERFIYQLKNDPTKKFIDYNVDTGIYVYEVNHF